MSITPSGMTRVPGAEAASAADVTAGSKSRSDRIGRRATLSDVMDAGRREERRRALRGLLRRPILTADSTHPSTTGNSASAANSSQDDFVLVRRHQGYLTHWFARYTGWTLILRGGSARLVKRTAEIDDATRGAVDPSSSGGLLSRQRYVLWCLALAVLHQEGRQTTLQRLADQMMRMAGSTEGLVEAGCEYDLKSVSTRRAIVCVVRLLIRYGVLVRVEGDEESYVNGSGDCLYDIRTGVLTDMLHLPKSLQAMRIGPTDEPLAALVAVPSNDDDDGQLRNRVLEQRLIGRLLDNPVMYFDELTVREFSYWQSQRPRLLQVIEEATGLVAEVRGEGVAMLDADGDLTDTKMPEAGTVGHATLLLAEFFAAHYTATVASPDQTTAEVPMEMIMAHLTDLAGQHRSVWRKNLGDPGQLGALRQEVLGRLEMLRLIRRTATGIVPLAAVCRFAVDTPQPGRTGTKKGQTRKSSGSRA